MALAYAFLIAAVAAEVVGAVATRFSDGFTRVLPTALTVAAVIGAYWLLSLSLEEGMTIGVAYAMWAATGVTAVAVIGAAFLGDRLSRVQVAGVVLTAAGVGVLHLGGGH